MRSVPELFAARITTAVVILACGFLAVGCTSQPAAPNGGSVVSSLGAVPIPSAPTGTPAPVTASIGHPQLIAMGAPVRVTLPGEAQALITTSGPDLASAGAHPNAAVQGTITVTATASAGAITLAAADLACRDQTGTAVPLTATGPATATATPGHPATLRLTGSFRSGDAQINWQHTGHVLAIWDFTVEND